MLTPLLCKLEKRESKHLLVTYLSNTFRVRLLSFLDNSKNLLAKYQQLSVEDQQDKDLIHQLRLLDLNVNVNWPLVHFKSAVRYLSSKDSDADATGGTNWQKYLPPRFQKRIFFPELWTKDEMENWGRKWVVNALNES